MQCDKSSSVNIPDLSNMTSSEWIDFKYYKEAQYEQRRVRIKEMCQQINDTKYLKVLNQPNKSSIPIFYNDKHNLTYCQIPKVCYLIHGYLKWPKSP
jgi:hypothetical protein